MVSKHAQVARRRVRGADAMSASRPCPCSTSGARTPGTTDVPATFTASLSAGGSFPEEEVRRGRIKETHQAKNVPVNWTALHPLRIALSVAYGYI